MTPIGRGSECHLKVPLKVYVKRGEGAN